jgi:hypothetical protein
MKVKTKLAISMSYKFNAMKSVKRLFFPEGGVGLAPKHGCLLTLAYYAFHRLYEFGERRWNDILTEVNRRTRSKTCPSATLSTTNPTRIDLGANPGLRCERPATNDLSHGTAQKLLCRYITIMFDTVHCLRQAVLFDM